MVTIVDTYHGTGLGLNVVQLVSHVKDQNQDSETRLNPLRVPVSRVPTRNLNSLERIHYRLCAVV